uniref:Uncharacterized protein n=1 Tax=Cacopsylla melanoneura TaxID=428564 RepID=A0A8D8TTN3_9HEMI
MFGSLTIARSKSCSSAARMTSCCDCADVSQLACSIRIIWSLCGCFSFFLFQLSPDFGSIHRPCFPFGVHPCCNPDSEPLQYSPSGYGLPYCIGDISLLSLR